MDPKSFQDLLDGNRGDDLSEVEARGVDELLETSAASREALAEAERQLAPLVDASEPPEPSPEQWARVTSGLKAELAVPRPIPFPGPRRGLGAPALLAIAAAAMFLVGVGVLLTGDWRPLSNGTEAALTPEVAPLEGMGPDDVPGKGPAISDPGSTPPAEEPPVLEAARLVEHEAGEGYQVIPITLDGDLLTITLRRL